MTFEELLKQLQTVKCVAKRALEEDYCEVVVDKTNMPAATSVLEAFFGAPLKPAHKEASAEAKNYAGPHGGVHGNQILYVHKGEATLELALLWPWGNGEAVTLKIIRQAA